MRTERLLLRRWQPSDLRPFARMNACPEVMEFFPARLTDAETRQMVARIESGFDEQGFGLWALELVDTGEFIGFCGLSRPRFEAAFTPCVEVGWRIARPHWGNGYAPEAAREAIRDAFERVGLDEIVSFTAARNRRSVRVMEKLGMARNPADDFQHPLLESGHPLRPHVLYRLSSAQWLARAARASGEAAPRGAGL